MKKLRLQAGVLAAVLLADILLAANLGRVVWEAGGGERGEISAVPASERENGPAIDPNQKSPFLALTFDDGPHSSCTEELLDGLKDRGVKASFFLMGENIPGNERIIQRMKDEGHLIGTHCYSHVDLTRESMESAVSQIEKTNEMIEEITGTKPAYIRPPYGAWNEELEEEVQMTPVFWDIDTLDWKSQNSAAVLGKIERQAGKHQIVLMHDTFPSTVKAALAAIDTLKEQGYTFVTVDELLIE